MWSCFSRSEVARILNIKASRLRYWDRIGLVSPSFRESGGRAYYDFKDLVCLRTAQTLVVKGLTARKIQRSIEALRHLFPELDEHLSNKRIYVLGERVIISHKTRLIDSHSGQFFLKFDLDDFAQEVQGKVQVLETKSAEGWFQQGLLLDDREDYDPALDAYRKAVKLNPAFAEAYVRMGLIYSHQGKHIDAQRCFRLAIDRDTYHSRAYFHLGNVLDELNCVEEAIHCYEKSLEVDPHFSDAHYNLAAACEKLNLWEKALKHWKRYLALDSSSRFAGIARRRVKLVQSQLALKRQAY